MEHDRHCYSTLCCRVKVTTALDTIGCSWLMPNPRPQLIDLFPPCCHSDPSNLHRPSLRCSLTTLALSLSILQDYPVDVPDHGVSGRNIRRIVVDVFQSPSSSVPSIFPTGWLPFSVSLKLSSPLSRFSLNALLPPPQSDHPEVSFHLTPFLLSSSRAHLLVLCPFYALILLWLSILLLPKPRVIACCPNISPRFYAACRLTWCDDPLCLIYPTTRKICIVNTRSVPSLICLRRAGKRIRTDLHIK